MKEQSCLQVEIKENLAVVKLVRPQAKNALNKRMVEELDSTVNVLAMTETVLCVIITGAEDFAAGADINDMVDLTPEEAKAFSFRHTFSKIGNMPQPVIAAINGFALGGGLELALACDFRIASPKAKLGLPEIKLGIFPGAGGTQRLTKLIGISRAKEMIFTGEIIDAVTAMSYGLINALADDPLEEALRWAKKLTVLPPVALKLAKQCINLAHDMNTLAGIEFEALAWASTFATNDQKEGMKAFLEKRQPNFKGK